MQRIVDNHRPAIILAGLNHRTAPIQVRERVSLDACSLPMVSDDLIRAGIATGALQEVVIVSTCNRLEIYATSTDPASGFDLIRQHLASQNHLAPHELDPYLYLKTERDAIGHLMRVTSGLDSLILGEAQILGQVASAFTTAQASAWSGPILSQLFNRALHCGKRARTETPIGSYTTSLSHAAVRMAEAQLGNLAGRHVLVIGAGEMAELAATALHQHHAGAIVCINRTQARAERLAMTVGGRAVDWNRLDEALAATDLVISATSAPHLVLTRDQVAQAMETRAGRPLLFIDIALPRDIEVSAAELPGVTCYDIDHLRDSIDANLVRREAAIPQVEEIIDAQTEAVIDWLGGREVLPIVLELRRHAEAIAQQEVERTLHRLLHQSPRSERIEQEVGRLAERIVAKLLHEPTVRLKAQAATGNGAPYAGMLSDLFALDVADSSSTQPIEWRHATPGAAHHHGANGRESTTYHNGAFSYD